LYLEMTLTVKFEQLLASQLKAKPHLKIEGNLLALDPGETTGWSIWADGKLKDQGQVKTWPMEVCVPALQTVITLSSPSIVVYESYQVYEWKTEDHTWSQIPTVQVIGCLQTLLLMQKIPYHTQTAQVAKQFVSDERLEQWDFWFKGVRHARDSIRHGLYFQLFGPSNTKK
jgi:hypothetical protein